MGQLQIPESRNDFQGLFSKAKAANHGDTESLSFN